MRHIKQMLWLVVGLNAIGALAQGDPRASALAAWYFGDGIVGETNPITATGFINYNVVPAGRGARPTQRTAQLVTPSYFDAGTGLGVSNNQITVFLRARMPAGGWNSGLLAKRGSLSTLNYNLFSVDLPGTAGNDIGFEVRTTNAFAQVSFPISRIDPTAWHNLIARYDGTNVQLFCNDRLMASAPLSGNLALNNEPTLIGAETDNGAVVRRFTGFIEEAAIWDVALSDEQIARLNDLTALPAPFSSSLLHYRHPDHDVGDVHVAATGGGRWDLTYMYLIGGNFYQAQLTTFDFLNFKWSNPAHAPVSGAELLPTWFAIESIWDPILYKWRSVWGYYGMRSALSDDRLNWYAASPQLLLWDPGSYRRFSDPAITRVGSNSWQMVITMAKQSLPWETGGSIGWATSSNLTQWAFKGDLFFPGNRGVPEVPTLFQVGDKWYLLASWYAGGVGRPTYQVADSPAGPWSEFSPNCLDGKDVCAATSDSDGAQRILLGWIPLNAWNNSGQHWGGHLCFPREIFQLPNGALRSRLPAAFADKIRGPQLFPALTNPSTKSGNWTYQGDNINCLSTSGQNRAILPGLFDRFDAEMTFTNNTGTARVGWLLDWQESGNFFEIGLSYSSQSLFIRTAGGTTHAELSVPVAQNTRHRLRVIVEEDMVEVVYDDQFTLAARIPTKLRTTSVGLFTEGGPANFPSVTVHRLKNRETIPQSVTIHVPSEQPTVLAALSVANPQDRIEIEAGTYSEADLLRINVPVTLAAVGGPVTLLVPADKEAIIEIAEGVTGVNFHGVQFERMNAASWMRSVQLQRGAAADFIDCTFTGPGSGVGAILFKGADATFAGCTFSNFNASATNPAAAILLEGHDASSSYTDLIVRDSVFAAGCNGWIKTSDSTNWPRIGEITVSNCTFRAANRPHAIKFRDGGAHVMNYDPAKSLLFQDCVFEGTSLEVAEFHYTTGGGPASLTFSRCEFKAYDSTRKMLWLDLPTPIVFENCLFAGGRHETVMTVWGGPPSANFYHCTMINDGITAAQGSASGTSQSSFIWGWDNGRTFNVVNCLFRCPVNYSAGFFGDAASTANRNYAVSYSVIDHPTPVGNKTQITTGLGYSNASLAAAFVNPSTRDYRLLDGAPWVGGATNLGYTFDLAQGPRIRDGTPDMGAYEFSAEIPAPTIAILSNEGKVTVTFTGVLQAAGQLPVGFTDVPGAVSPWLVPTTNTMRFFRSRSP